jgi:two-component system chemotaxis response regulator CheY
LSAPRIFPGSSSSAQRATDVEALEMHERLKPTLVTMDLTMPEMDGGECVAHLVERDPDIKILVISALADKVTAIDAIEKGASGFLCKPFTDRQLNEALRKLVGG